MRKNDSRGVSVGAFMILVLVLGGVIFAGFKVYERVAVTTVDESDTTVVATKKVPSKINNAGDLSDAEKALDAVDVDAESAALDSDLAGF